MKNSEVAQEFVYGQEAQVKNLFSESKNGKLVLYSYGYHFPLCVKLKDGTYLFNGDGYSMTTAKHKGELARALGFSCFKDMVQNKPNIILHNTEELKQLIYEDINSHADYLARKI